MPEEVNRVLTDAVSDLLFTTEPAAEENLRREGVDAEKIHFVGNVMIDTLFRYRERARESDVLDRLRLAPSGYAVLTLHRPSNVDDEGTLGLLLGAIARIQAEIPVVFPVHPRTRRRLEALAAVLPPMPGVRLADPMPYLDFVQLMGEARCILTDSGGIQEEATALGIPCLTLRHNTERPVTVTRGTNRIVGTDPEAIYRSWRDVAERRWPEGSLPELWDGKAAARIVRVLLGTAR
jgi:UDP-N-acetylglucosamine 2-epimerase (non-hydrolysing)